MKKNMYKIRFIVLGVLFFVPVISLAASISLDTQNDTFSQGQEFLVQVFLDTESDQVNAVEGTVLFSPENFEFIENREGNSSINFWVEKPHLSKNGEIIFSGITAGGFSGSKIFLFGFVLKSKNSSTNLISFKGVRIFKNDGVGTEISTKTLPLNITISKEDNKDYDLEKITDSNIPEGFIPEIASDPSIWDGQYFVVFSAVDKGSGIDHYELREGFWGEYVTTESPYLLKDQTLSKNIYIKAVDRHGNERVVKINAKNLFGFEVYTIIGIILIICILFGKKILRKLSR